MKLDLYKREILCVFYLNDLKTGQWLTLDMSEIVKERKA